MLTTSTRDRNCTTDPTGGTHLFIRRRQVSPREEEMVEEEEKTEEAAEDSGRRTARTGKSYSPRKKGKKRGALEDEDEESKQEDEDETPMQQVLRVTQNRGSSPDRASLPIDVDLFSSPDDSPPRGTNTHPARRSPMRMLRSAVGRRLTRSKTRK